MATSTKPRRKSGDACKASIRLLGIKPFTKSFRPRKHAMAWAAREERDIDSARAHGCPVRREMTLAELIQEYKPVDWPGPQHELVPRVMEAPLR